jgi:hypothetical protein
MAIFSLMERETAIHHRGFCSNRLGWMAPEAGSFLTTPGWGRKEGDA